MAETRNRFGGAYALTVFTPILAGHEDAVQTVIEALPVGADSPLARLDGLHFSRLQIFRELVHQGDKQRKRDRLRSSQLVFTSTFDGELDPYLFFESNFDGPWQHYIDAFAYVIPKDIRLTWGRGPSFPAPPPSEPLKAWIARNSMEGGTYYCAHADHSTRMVKSALTVSERFEALQRSAGRLGPEAFKVEWERFLSDTQAHL